MRVFIVAAMMTLSASVALANGLVEIARMTVENDRVEDVIISVGGTLGGTISVNGVQKTIEEIDQTRVFNVDVSSDKTIIIESESASNLIRLNCNNGSLTSLDVSTCFALCYLFCSDNALTSLDVSGLVELKYLYCSGNALTSLDTSGCISMKSMYAEHQEVVVSVPSKYNRTDVDIFFNGEPHAFPIDGEFFINFPENIPNKSHFSGTVSIVRYKGKKGK